MIDDNISNGAKAIGILRLCDVLKLESPELYDSVTLMLLAATRIERLEAELSWTPPELRMPAKGTKVNVKCLSKYNVIYETMAYYIAEKSILAEEFFEDFDEEDMLYDETIDNYWTPAGWYEYQEMSETSYLITDTVVGWRHIS